MTNCCGDNRFEIIKKAKKDILQSTNIEEDKDEMKVLDNFLFRCWQMGWLEKYETTKSPWISVKDRLPTGGGHYLCMDDNHNIAVLAFVGDKWINTKTFTDVPLEVVIYWMPKPPLPKE